MPWQLVSERASLQCGRLQAQLDAGRPAGGLTAVAYDQSDLPPLQAFRLGPAAQDAPAMGPLEEVYIRQADLVASYAATTAFPVSSQVYWRALEAGTDAVCGVELWVSAETSLLHSESLIACETLLPPGTLHALDRAGQSDFRERDTNTPAPQGVIRDSEALVLMFRAPSAAWTYCQMIHPSDVTRVNISSLDDSRTRVTALLFAEEQLEKGVIRRARLRGLFLPRRHDTELAAAAFRQFADSELPLTV